MKIVTKQGLKWPLEKKIRVWVVQYMFARPTQFAFRRNKCYIRHDKNAKLFYRTGIFWLLFLLLLLLQLLLMVEVQKWFCMMRQSAAKCMSRFEWLKQAGWPAGLNSSRGQLSHAFCTLIIRQQVHQVPGSTMCFIFR